MTISERIFRLLQEKGITQKEFSERSGISQSAISDWKRKGTNPSADKIMTICSVLQITPYELLQDTGGIDGEPAGYRIISEGTTPYGLIEIFEALDADGKARTIGYMQALRNMRPEDSV